MNNEFDQKEPALRDLLEDPIIHAVLKRDGLTVEDVKKVVYSYQKAAKKISK